MTKPSPASLGRMLLAARVAGFVRDEGGTAWLATPGLSTALGYDEQWVPCSESRWASRVHEEDSFEFFAAIAELGEQGRAFSGRVVRLRHRHGGWLSFRCEGVPDTEAAMVILTDITPQRELESALLDSQLRLRGLYDSTPAAIVLWSREGRITDWNPMATATFGYPRDAMIGQKLVPRLVAPADYDRFAASIADCLRDNRTSELVCGTLAADGRLLQCQWRSVPLRSPKGSLLGIFSLAMDVTAQLAAEEALQHAKETAESLSRAKSEFMATISHELRTPLNGILGMAQVLQSLTLGEEEMAFVDSIRESGDTLLAIVNAIVRYTEADLDDAAGACEPFSIEEVVAVLADGYSIRAGRKGIGFEFELDERLHVPVVGDRQAIETVLANLLDNAVRFTDAGGIKLRVALAGEAAGRLDVRCEVADTGVGMSADFVAQHLFTPFKQAENAIVRQHGGVGLGLALAKKLSQRLGGSLHASSKPGQGSTFVFEFPVRPEAT